MKMDYVSYNPKKGLEFTMRVIEYCQTNDRYKHIKFVPLEGLSEEKLRSFYKVMKLHMDFSEFPGRERIPREASMFDCCIITGVRGASKYYEDVPIPDKYKFEATTENLPKIAERIQECLTRYEDCVNDFQEYKKLSMGIEGVFEKQILDIFQKVQL
jgi:hypothetical protein